MEGARSFRTVAAFGGHDYMTTKVVDTLLIAFGSAKKTALVGGCAFGVSMFIMFGMYACAFSLGAHLIRNGDRTGDDIMKVFFALACAAMGVGQTAGIAPDTSKFKSSVASIFKLIDRKPEIDLRREGKKVVVTGDIKLQSVSFSYPTRPDAKVCLLPLFFSLLNFCTLMDLWWWSGDARHKLDHSTRTKSRACWSQWMRQIHDCSIS
jgi:ATP-binding cassette subfamily B (MDR/TAP) protein 1